MLKIDGSFVRDILKDPRAESMVQAIAQLARSMNIVTVAEYVETDEIRLRVAALGVDYGQGFAIARPVPLAETLAICLTMCLGAATADEPIETGQKNGIGDRAERRRHQCRSWTLGPDDDTQRRMRDHPRRSLTESNLDGARVKLQRLQRARPATTRAVELLHLLVDFVLHLDKHLVELLARFDVWIYAILFLVIFAETGFVVTPFLPGDSLLFALGALAAVDTSGTLSAPMLAVLLTVAAILGNTVNYAIGKTHRRAGLQRALPLHEAWSTCARPNATSSAMAR